MTRGERRGNGGAARASSSPRRDRIGCRRPAKGVVLRSFLTGRCARTADGSGISSGRSVAPSRASLHDLHEAVGIEDLEFPLDQRGPELLPGDDLDPVVPAFRELNSVGSLDATRSKSFLLRLLDGVLDAYRLHHHPIPPGRGANRRARANLEVAI